MRKGNCGIELVFKFSIDMRSGPSYNEFQEKRRWFCGFWWGVPRIERSMSIPDDSEPPFRKRSTAIPL